jgi:hypothetical protein
MTFVIWRNYREVIVTTKKKEPAVLKACFKAKPFTNPDGEGDRDMDEWDRDISEDDCVGFSSTIWLDW